ncbi:MAG: 1-acyl-sn-glycerol-3-phosphate acyltransferase [Synergistaceae bacterium]|nr:1-acyl-sn-glycerol-3-phosphate acyltransferase [Synergistaceae bacterium]
MLSRLFYFLVKNAYLIFFRIFNRLEVLHRERIPQKRPLILASNHCSNLDPPVVGSVFEERMRYIAKAALFKPALFGFALKSLGAVPVSREDERKAALVLKAFLGFLESGQNILIFPEGKRSQDGNLQPLEGGVALLCQKSGCPILPVHVSGTFSALPMGCVFPRPAKIVMNYGYPIDPAEFPNGLSEKEGRAWILERLASEYRRLESESAAYRNGRI